jgi:signal transduction histidine kinase
METKVNTLMNVDFQVREGERLDALSEYQASQLFAIAHEALANVRKHAHAKNVSITLEPGEDSLRLVVGDDGTGMKANGRDHPTGRGLGNMAERAASLSGRLDIESNPGQGTSLTVEIPFAGEAVAAESAAG